MNKELYNTSQGSVEFPEDMREHMRICFVKAKTNDDTLDGYKRNRELQKQQQVDYKQLKRIKNFLTIFKGVIKINHSFSMEGLK